MAGAVTGVAAVVVVAVAMILRKLKAAKFVQRSAECQPVNIRGIRGKRGQAAQRSPDSQSCASLWHSAASCRVFNEPAKHNCPVAFAA